ncbi:MAG: FG-GAP repeat protein [Anaerolineae bacterium]|nr:FG-GAP repeat protein [Anaerolineae bacterium]
MKSLLKFLLASAIIFTLLPAVTLPSTATAAPPSEEIPEDWWDQVQADIRLSEYDITWQDSPILPDLAAAYQAPNRAQNLRFYFTQSGIRVIPRTGDATWELGLGVADADPAELAVQERYITYQRTNFAETFSNTENGLQHEVILSNATTFDLAFSGNLTLQIAADGASVEFITASGVPVLRYGNFSAVDDAGRNAPIQISQPDANHLRFTSHVSRFTFHALLTALPNTANWSVESNQADAQLGFSVAGAGDVNGDGFSDVLVGAPTYDGGAAAEGRVYGYYGAAGGLSTTASWTKEMDQAGAQFGTAVASAGDVNGDGYADVIIGAPNYANGQTQEGAAFVYHGAASGLSAAANWQYESDKAGAHLGAAVSSTGYAHSSTYTGVLVGAPEFNETMANQGKAFAFYGGASGLNVAPDWSNVGDQTGATFGAAVSCAGDVDGDGYHDILVGAPGYDDNTTGDTGAAFVYHGGAGGIDALPGWQVLGDSENARLGASVSLAGDVNGNGYGDVIVGAPGYANGENTDAGVAYVFLGASGGLTTTVGWSVTGIAPDTQLGASVALAGDVDADGYADVLVGAPGYSDGEAGEGVARLYSGSATGLSAAATWAHSPNQAGAHLGAALAGAGDVNGDGFGDVLTGAPGYSHPESNEGGAFAFYGAADSLSQTANWSAVGGSGINFGYAVNTAGDVNGDGYSDVIIGAPLYDTALTNAGRIFVYLGSANGLATTAITTRDGDVAEAQFGYVVSTAGDVDGDGDDDLLVGAPYYNNGQAEAGRAYVYFGNAGGLEEHPSWYAESIQTGARLGRSVACAGDVNGDGYSDIIVGAPRYDNGETDEGNAFIWLGNSQVKIGAGAGRPNNAYWTGQPNRAEASFGIAVAGAGDVDGDGYSDVLVSASGYNDGQVAEGAAFLYLGGSGAMSTNPIWQVESNQVNAFYGSSVSSAGDVNGDGFSDFLVGASWFDNGQTDEGAVFIYYGTNTTINTAPDRILEMDQNNAHFGTAVGSAGDLNGDGYADVIVGAPEYRESLVEYGSAFVYYGSSTGLSAAPDWNVRAAQTNTKLGISVGGAGDVNGDGFNDLIVGTQYNYANVYYGNNGSMSLRPRQLQPTGGAYLTPLGRTNAPGSVEVNLQGKTPLGYDRLKLEWQVTPLGQPFGGPGTISGTSDTWTTSGATFAQTITGLASSSAYHWRVRLRYRAGNPLGVPASRWVHMPHNGWLETDFKTAPGALTGVTATNDSPTTIGNTTTFTGASNSTYVTYTWVFGDSATGNGKSVTHTYGNVGHYEAQLTASNGASTVIVTTGVNILDEPIAGLTMANSSPTIAENTTFFTASITAGTHITYTWNFGDDSPIVISDDDNTVQHVYTNSGNFTAIVTASNTAGQANASSPVTISDAPITGLTLANSSPTPLDDATFFTASVTGGTSIVYDWAFGDGQLLPNGGATVQHVYPAEGNYTASVTATNRANNMSASTLITITPGQPVSGLLAFNDGPTPMGTPTTLSATVETGSGVTYTWAFGDGEFFYPQNWPDSGKTVTHVYPEIGIYTATVTATNRAGQLSATTAVTIVEAPITGLAAHNDSPTMLGAATTLSATVTGGSHVVYTWDLGDGETAVGATVLHTYPDVGIFTATVTATNSLDAFNAATTVTIVPARHIYLPLVMRSSN